MADFVWTKDGTLLVPDNRTLVEHEQLHIHPATLNDSGLYICHARISKAIYEARFIVNVTGETIQLECYNNLPKWIPDFVSWFELSNCVKH